MKSLIDLKKELKEGNLTQNLYIFTGEENYIRRLYYLKIGEIYGNLKSLDTVSNLYRELEKRALFGKKPAYIVYNDVDFLKQKEKVYQNVFINCHLNVNQIRRFLNNLLRLFFYLFMDGPVTYGISQASS